MDDYERREQIRQFWEQTGTDHEASHAIYHDDAVLEFPHSGERLEWRARWRAA